MAKNRDERGRFVKGTSGNPAGRPKNDSVADRLFPLVPRAVERIRMILEDPESVPRDVLRAADIVLSRVYGLPRQAVEIDAADATIRIVDTDPDGAEYNG